MHTLRLVWSHAPPNSSRPAPPPFQTPQPYFAKQAEVLGVYNQVVDEGVVASVVEDDEANALLYVEPLAGAQNPVVGG